MQQPSDPAVEPARIESLYNDLATMQVELDADPLGLGPKRLNEKVSQSRGMLSRCETIYLSVSQDLYRYKRRLRSASADFKLQLRDLLTNDPEVRMGRNVTDREAIASNKLRPEAEVIDHLTACVEDLEAVLTVVRMKRADLKDIQGRLKDQLKICQEEISLGGRWNVPSQRRARVESHKPSSEEPEEGSVQQLLDTVFPSVVGAKTIPEEIVGDPNISADSALESIPNEPSVPVIFHPDSAMFSDVADHDFLSLL